MSDSNDSVMSRSKDFNVISEVTPDPNVFYDFNIKQKSSEMEKLNEDSDSLILDETIVISHTDIQNILNANKMIQVGRDHDHHVIHPISKKFDKLCNTKDNSMIYPVGKSSN